MSRVSKRKWFAVAALVGSAIGAPILVWADDPPSRRIDSPIVFVQLPVDPKLERAPGRAGGTLRAEYGAGGRIVRLDPDGTLRVLTDGFHSACDPAISFDAQRILFAAKRSAQAPWDIWEMNADGTGPRQITKNLGNCRSPAYQAVVYTLMAAGTSDAGTDPWQQIMFVSDAAGALNEYGGGVSTSLYSCTLDGTNLRRLTFNLSNDLDPFLMDDGRVLLAGWQRMDLRRGWGGRVTLFGVNMDGTDYALFCGDEGRRIKHLPCVTTDGLAVFVEGDSVGWDGAGQLGSVTLRRPLHSYRPVTKDPLLLYHSPSPLPEGEVLVSCRPADGGKTHALYRLNPGSGQKQLVFDDPEFHEIHAKALLPRARPDGRSSVVNERIPTGKLYCLSAYEADLTMKPHLRPGTIKTVRVIEGVPLPAAGRNASGGGAAFTEGGSDDGAFTEGGSDGDAALRRWTTSGWFLREPREFLVSCVGHGGPTLHRRDAGTTTPHRLEAGATIPHRPEAGATNPGATSQGSGSSTQEFPPIVSKRLLGLAPVEEDGSFHIELPPDVPVQIQVLDADGLALATCGWIWVKPREWRGCIGCHEDPELTPENRFVLAVRKPAVQLTLPAEKRRSVDFQRDILPIVAAKCAACHPGEKTKLDLRSERHGHFNIAYESLLVTDRSSKVGGGETTSAPAVVGRYVHPGLARTSPLAWRLMGRNTSRPWDAVGDVGGKITVCPPPGAEQLTEAERRAIFEWIDLGAPWASVPAQELAAQEPLALAGG